MSSTNPMRRELRSIVLTAVLSLFLLPLISYLFASYVMPRGALQSGAAPLSPLWQFQVVMDVSAYTLVAGILLLTTISGLGAAAFFDRRTQYLSFVIGWRLLTFACAVEVVIQGILLVWLSFWVTAVFFKIYILKLILVIAIGAALAVFYAVVCIFKRVPRGTDMEGEPVDKDNAPALWAHVRSLAEKANILPPDHIVAGIDTNFFVTEAPINASGRALRGRILYVSVPLLRLLDRTEADAVLAHELAHFRGGDTASSAALGPKIVQFDYYLAMMRGTGVTFLVFYILRLYRVIFEFALKRDSRTREFLADQAAASLVSAPAVIGALIKIGAYARYRGEVEQGLFANQTQHEANLGIAARIADGLPPYATSARFLDAMQVAGIPHPFDSHPSLPERMQNVGHMVREQDYSAVVTTPPAATWIEYIPGAEATERSLWSNYEARFNAAHELQLAYRYLPATEVERAIVRRHFPPAEFALRGGKRIVVSHEGLVLPKQTESLSWDSITNMKYEDGFGGDVLQIIHPEKGWFGAKSTKVKLPGIGKQRARLKGTLANYFQRHQMARHYANAVATPP